MTNVRTPAILDEIVASKRREVQRSQAAVGIERLEERIESQSQPFNPAGALWGDSVRVIAEVKRASPTRGLLRADFDAASLAASYVANGAAVISVITNVDHFQGSLEHLEAVTLAAHPHRVPVLRKDFIFDPYQVYESRAHGADAILLIVAILAPGQLRELLELAQRFWMQCLVEVHDQRELSVALDAGAEIVGINNRDLRTFETDLQVTERLAPLVPAGKVIVSESGVSTAEHVQRAGRAGAHAVLVGEALMAAPDPGAKLRELVA